MLFNYLKLSLRLLVRNPFFTVINVLGLSIGLASFLALWDYSSSELKANQFFKDFERIARIGTYWRYTDDGQKWDEIVFGFSKSDLPGHLKADFPDIESYVRILTPVGFDNEMVPHEERISISLADAAQPIVFKETQVVYADSNLFTFFSIPLLKGQPDKVLSEAGYVALSQETAKKYFGQADPIGKMLKLNDSLTLQVTGVFKDLPHNTHLNFTIVISNAPYLTAWSKAYFGITQNFVKLHSSVSFHEFEDKINAERDKYLTEILKDKSKNNSEMFIQSLQDIPFASHEGDKYYKRSKTLLTALATVSVVVLMMAWSNYINMTIARTSKRLKEFATRKANGAMPWDLIKQFLVDACLVNLLALLLAFTLLQFIQEPAKHYFNIHVGEISEMSRETIFIFFGTMLGGIVITGLYPAVTSLSYRTTTLFRVGSTSPSKRIIPAVLTVMQFSSAIVLILWAFVVFLELNFILNKNYGLDRANVVVVEAPLKKSNRYLEDIKFLSENISRHSFIDKVTYSKLSVGDFIGPGKGLRRLGSDKAFGFDPNGVNETYLDFYRLKLVAGRNFRVNESPSSTIISLEASRRLGFATPADALGARLETNLDFGGTKMKQIEVVGVIEDYRTMDFLKVSTQRSDIQQNGESRGSMLTYKNSVFPDYLPEKIEIKIMAGNLTTALSQIESDFKKSFPGNPFTWYFLDDHINRAYMAEKIARNQILLFTFMAVSIACLGLLGMIAHKAVEKTKEIGIRKILGAELFQIMIILMNTTLKQFFIAVVIGLPVALYLAEQYLQKYSERVPIMWWHYMLPIFLLALILIGTVVTVLWRAAKNNPVDALKCE